MEQPTDITVIHLSNNDQDSSIARRLDLNIGHSDLPSTRSHTALARLCEPRAP